MPYFFACAAGFSSAAGFFGAPAALAASFSA